jgi:hypothetical protein
MHLQPDPWFSQHNDGDLYKLVSLRKRPQDIRTHEYHSDRSADSPLCVTCTVHTAASHAPGPYRGFALRCYRTLSVVSQYSSEEHLEGLNGFSYVEFWQSSFEPSGVHRLVTLWPLYGARKGVCSVIPFQQGTLWAITSCDLPFGCPCGAIVPGVLLA